LLLIYIKKEAMKKVIAIVFAFVAITSVSAQKVIRGGGGYYRRPVVVVGAYAPLYPYYGLYGYPYMYPYGYGYDGYYGRPSKLDMQIADIRHDYEDRIASVRMDKSMTGKERRDKIRDLRHERDKEVDNARADYYKTN
jgi:hypothetical protein